MADILHSSLTGADLHESKGAASASLGQVAVADGAGSAPFTSLNYSYLTGKPTIPAFYNGVTSLAAPQVRTYSVSAVAGVWTVSLSGFTTVYSVCPTVVSGGTGLGTAATATLGTYSTSSATGNVIVMSASANALGSTQTVLVTVIGV